MKKLLLFFMIAVSACSASGNKTSIPTGSFPESQSAESFKEIPQEVQDNLNAIYSSGYKFETYMQDLSTGGRFRYDSFQQANYKHNFDKYKPYIDSKYDDYYYFTDADSSKYLKISIMDNKKVLVYQINHKTSYFRYSGNGVEPYIFESLTRESDDSFIVDSPSKNMYYFGINVKPQHPAYQITHMALETTAGATTYYKTYLGFGK